MVGSSHHRRWLDWVCYSASSTASSSLAASGQPFSSSWRSCAESTRKTPESLRGVRAGEMTLWSFARNAIERPSSSLNRFPTSPISASVEGPRAGSLVRTSRPSPDFNSGNNALANASLRPLVSPSLPAQARITVLSLAPECSNSDEWVTMRSTICGRSAVGSTCMTTTRSLSAAAAKACAGQQHPGSSTTAQPLGLETELAFFICVATEHQSCQWPRFDERIRFCEIAMVFQVSTVRPRLSSDDTVANWDNWGVVGHIRSIAAESDASSVTRTIVQSTQFAQYLGSRNSKNCTSRDFSFTFADPSLAHSASAVCQFTGRHSTRRRFA